MADAKELLCQILVKIEENQSQKLSSLLVFDLDSTLFDVSPRIQKILRDFASIPEFREKYAKACSVLEHIETQSTDWGIKDAIIRSGLVHEDHEFYEAVRQFWRTYFFSNEYIHHDKAYPGALDFVNSAFHAGAQIAYLTGRDQHRMGLGSRQVLLEQGFPLDDQQAVLALKPHKDHEDAEFKKTWFVENQYQKHANTWFFENEPVNLHLVDEHLKDVQLVFFESTHSRQKEPLAHVPTIRDYLFR